MPHRLQFDHWVPLPVEKLFLFFANPNNLPKIMPSQTGTRLDELHLVAPPAAGTRSVESLAGAGSTIITSFRIFPGLPFRAKWIARITEFEWDRYFEDIQEKGPFKSFQHRHEFSKEDRDGVAGTSIHDVINYEVGYGFAGEIAEKLFIRRELQRTFAYRQQALEKTFVTKSFPPPSPAESAYRQ